MIMFESCGYRLCTDITEKKLQIINDINSISLCSYDPFGPITRAIMTELRVNQIGVVDYLNNDLCIREVHIPCLHILGASEKYITTFVFQNGKEAGYQLVLHIRTNLFIPNKNCCPINIRVYRSFIRNPGSALFNDTQENDIRKDMYRDAAQQLIHQLFLRFDDF
ncbi:LPS assembly lipoprotein LptE [Candidatus Blochmannia sp. SNP]|uniref:LPS assembly lipoprotein LptE n=1 Tax=Candidatus Blochmannia sp. SNP TaxID=3118169 RepID=UPI002F95DFD9